MNRRGNSGFLRSVHVSRKSGLGLLDDGLESLRIGDSQLGESATIQLDAGKVQALDEAVVGDAFGADGSVDALDPQLAEVALASLAVEALSITTRRFLWAFTARLTRAIFDSSAFY